MCACRIPANGSSLLVSHQPPGRPTDGEAPWVGPNRARLTSLTPAQGVWGTVGGVSGDLAGVPLAYCLTGGADEGADHRP